MNTPFEYLGTQPGIAHLPPVELYNLRAPVGIYPAGSTVSRKTLELHGYNLPAVDAAERVTGKNTPAR